MSGTISEITGQSILDTAHTIYGEAPGSGVEYGYGGNNGDDYTRDQANRKTLSGPNGIPEVDCTHLIQTALQYSGFCVPFISTGDFRNNNGTWKKYYEKLGTDLQNAQVGDIIVFNGHAVFYAGNGQYYGSNGGTNGPAYVPVGPNGEFVDGNVSLPIEGIFRPKAPGYCRTKPPKLPASPTSLPRRDPLLLDLDGNGIQTVGKDADIYFDHDGNGLKELTGWVAPGDGMLVLDRNVSGGLDNGSELFGSFTPLSNGMLAANGFEALAQFDTNGDGKIDANDPIWSQLHVWQFDPEASTDLDGHNLETSGKLNTLDELGIAAIYLNSTITNTSDGQGNAQTRLGRFDKADGTSGDIAEYNLFRDTSQRLQAEYLDVPSDIAALPDADGFGNVYDLHQAMVRDTTGQLKTLVQSFVAETNSTNRDSILQQIILKWTGADKVATNSHGPYMDGRKVAALEKFYGTSLGNPNSNFSVVLEQTYREVSAMIYGQLMAESRLVGLFDLVTYTVDLSGFVQGDFSTLENIERKANLSAAVVELQNRLANDPISGKQDLSEFARVLRTLDHLDSSSYLSFRETFLNTDPTLGWLIDTAGLPPYTPTNYYGHFIGTNQSEAMQTSLTLGDGVLNGYSGNDVMYGTDRLTGPYGGEWFFQELGNATIVGAGGPDIIWAGEGNDLLDGGPGSDTLAGESGSDTYIFRRGSGQDVIIESVYGYATLTDTDTIWLGSNLTPQDIAVRRVGNNLVLSITNSPDTVTVKDYFTNPLNRIERIQFQDGTAWTEADWLARLNAPTGGDMPGERMIIVNAARCGRPRLDTVSDAGARWFAA